VHRRIAAGVFAVVLGLPVLGLTDPKRSTPPPASTPTPVLTTPTLPPLPDKPKPMWGDGNCAGAMVFLDNKSWRECCLLCAVGDDHPSSVEKQQAERDHEKIVVTNYFSLAAGGRSGRGGEREDGDEGGGRESAGHARAEKKDESLHRRYRFGIPAMKSLSPSLGGSESR